MTVFKSLEEWQKKTGFNLNNFKEVKTAESRGVDLLLLSQWSH